MIMYKIPLNILKLLNNEEVENEKILYQNKNFFLFVDLKNKKKNYHYTAWYKHNIPSLEYANFIVLQHIKDLNKELLEKKIIYESTELFVNFPPDQYRLHIHFIEKRKSNSFNDFEYNIERMEKFLELKFLSKL